ncbi:hypothetical protein IGI04_002388 [Brassica rapa subsp. trilocularis]|uniref:Uncharacterized protein n=1 Tax=Brassica rapa subsp. trilocularis TaxID=1813537 RepID=A0ABQ7NW81_BRACM|nr:hypothetical protein IGI04_002388 [Brassica rapa subsp. trilocularis]
MTPPRLIVRSTVQECGLARFTRIDGSSQNRLYGSPTPFLVAIYYTRVWTRQIYSVLHHHCVFITLNCLKHQRFFTESALRSSYPIPRCRYYCTRVWIHLIFCYYITIASPSRYSVSSIDDSSQSRVDSPNLFDTTSSLRFHQITPSQALTVLDIVSYVTRSRELLSSTKIHRLFTFKTHLFGFSTSLSTSLCSFEYML